MTKKILAIAISLLALFACNKKDINSLKDEVSDLQTRVTVLEELCKQNNTNITSLQTLVNASNTQGDYITSVTPITKEGKEIGYAIAFAKQAAITIYNGEDGENAQAPEIGVKKFTDDVYYWTLNGNWLLDDNEEKIQVTGKDGSNGTDGITPQLKVEDDNWYVSYDKGETWTFISKAKGEDGKNGDSMFHSVTSDDYYAYFTLVSGEIIKIPTFSWNQGAIHALFSVSETKKVAFSQGNLQYQASTNTWRFAENQYDIIGSDNSNVSATYSGYIDLFCYGTSGWNSGVTCYQPYSVPTSDDDSVKFLRKHLLNEYENADWGVYNKIANGGNSAKMWRTLTGDEWAYLLSGRTNADSLIVRATINGIKGIIFLPDDFSLSGNNAITIPTTDFTTNNLSIEQWKVVENCGAIFLPAAGWRGCNMQYLDRGLYWSSTIETLTVNKASDFRFGCSEDNIARVDKSYIIYGFSVRLVQDVK